MKTKTTKKAILIFAENGQELGYWSTLSDDVSRGNPDLFEENKEIEEEIKRAKKIAKEKNWTCSFGIEHHND